MLILKSCRYLSFETGFTKGDIGIDKGVIAQIGSINEETNHEIIDIKDAVVIPGLIDIHFHGAIGLDIMEASCEEIKKISSYLAKHGTTSYLATTITSSRTSLKQALLNIKEAAENNDMYGASIEGIHVEGPFINGEKKGCHDVNYIRHPDKEEYKDIKSTIGNSLKVHFTIAPEICGALEFISHTSKLGASISIGHTNADSVTVKSALEAGAIIFTHLYNAMRGIEHREPGAAGAALISDCYVELICDGVHVHPDIVNITYRLKGAEKIVLVTDAMKAAGLGDGAYNFGGFKVIVKDGIARQENGTLASSTLNMIDAVRNVIKFTNASLEEAVRMASINPAKVIGIDEKTGSIEIGKRADLIVLEEDLSIREVYCRGVKVK